MSNPFQDQLLKAGLVNKKQVKKANQEKARSNKKQRQSKEEVVNEVKLKIQQAAQEKAKRDKALNQKKQEQAKNKAISSEINQLISNNGIERDENCDIPYNFEHRKKVNRIYINAEMKQQIALGKLGIARIDGRYELVPLNIAEKIRQRNEKRIIIFEKEQEEQRTDENDPYSDYQIPDDLTW
ncbi:Nucleoprotein/polynucleotide-associated enzyme [hydrothermal vent metagenome]|uniref:Nucleoprotein/polynucleotide-associated enzyme n=1 Tax=hydrothermal vent metagenome TaxID=652676 RepID=A0A3B0W7T0_9ZZZZ